MDILCGFVQFVVKGKRLSPDFRRGQPLYVKWLLQATYRRVFSSTHLRALTKASIHGVTSS